MTSGKIVPSWIYGVRRIKSQTSDTKVYDHKRTIMVQVNFCYRQRLKRQIKKIQAKILTLLYRVSPNQKFLLPINSHIPWPWREKSFITVSYFVANFYTKIKLWLCFSPPSIKNITMLIFNNSISDTTSLQYYKCDPKRLKNTYFLIEQKIIKNISELGIWYRMVLIFQKVKIIIKLETILSFYKVVEMAEYQCTSRGIQCKITVVVVQLLSHVQLFVTSQDCSTQDFPVLHHLPEFAKTHVH